MESLPTIQQVETERKRYRRQKAYNKALSGTVYVLTIVAAVAVLIATLVLPVLQIEGTSMEPTLVNGDIVLLTKTTNFQRGELCGFSWNNKLLIKRVIGVPGDWIEIDTDGTQNGWCAVTYEGVALGGGKISGGRVKNHYPKGLRNN
jgi:signal peptidase I